MTSLKNKTAMFKNILSTGSAEEKKTPENIVKPAEEVKIQTADGDFSEKTAYVDTHTEEFDCNNLCSDEIGELRAEIEELRKTILDFGAENEKFVTSKELQAEYMRAVSRRDAELANRKMMNMLTQLCIMREDFFKLCSDMESKLDKFTPGEILGSFTAYETDMENILCDAGVFIGKFDYDKLNTIHQRIIDVIPTDESEKDGMVAERLSDGYSFEGRVLHKEKVKVYRYAANSMENKNNEEE
jgi:molecular chaperone GrpE (heat shock protein)